MPLRLGEVQWLLGMMSSAGVSGNGESTCQLNRPEYPGDSLVRIKPRWPIQLFAHSTQFLVLLVAHYQWTPLGGGC